jgi:hypothetical protein
VKDFNESGEFKEDMTFMTNGDVPSLALKNLIEKPVNPFTKKEIPLDTTEIKKDGVVVTPNDLHQAWLYKDWYTYPVRDDQWWRVKDSIFKASSWSRENTIRFPSRGRAARAASHRFRCHFSLRRFRSRSWYGTGQAEKLS